MIGSRETKRKRKECALQGKKKKQARKHSQVWLRAMERGK